MTRNETKSALQVLARIVRFHYGNRLRGIYLVDTRREYEPEDQPDEEIVVVLEDGDWRSFDEKMALADLTYDALLETDLFAVARPIAKSEWDDPSRAREPITVRQLKARAEALVEAVQA